MRGNEKAKQKLTGEIIKQKNSFTIKSKQHLSKQTYLFINSSGASATPFLSHQRDNEFLLVGVVSH
jgi:hypothetical protein